MKKGSLKKGLGLILVT